MKWNVGLRGVDGPIFLCTYSISDSKISYLEAPEVPTLRLSSSDILHFGFANIIEALKRRQHAYLLVDGHVVKGNAAPL